MSKIEEFKTNILKAYKEIHGEHGVVGDETHMMFHGTQRPWEFFRAWEIIERYMPKTDDVSFLEIGAAKGLWAIAFIEMCKLYKKNPIYVTVSLIEHPSLRPHEVEWNRTLINVKNYYGDQVKEWVLFDENSQVDSTRDMVTKIHPSFDFVFIDGEHTYHAVYQDTRLYNPLAKTLLMYHDIAYTHSVFKAIQDHNIKLDYKIKAPGTGEGIGIQVK